MSASSSVPNSGAIAPPDTRAAGPEAPQECMTCRIIGTGALAATGLYALNQSRAHQPGSVVGKRIMAGVGICECFALLARTRSLTDIGSVFASRLPYWQCLPMVEVTYRP